MQVLLIEPDKLLAQVYGAALERAGHQVAHAVSAQSAVHAADEQLPDVVLLELQLPRHNGVEFLYEFRSYSEWCHIPVLLHTYVRPHELAPAAAVYAQLGVIDTLYKPATSLEQLCAAVALVGSPARAPALLSTPVAAPASTRQSA